MSQNNITLGFISTGGLLNVPYNEQPSVKLLKVFEIHDYFNGCRLLEYKHINKGDIIRPTNRTLYIDDNTEQLDWIRHKNINNLDLINRNMFECWSDLFNDE